MKKIYHSLSLLGLLIAGPLCGQTLFYEPFTSSLNQMSAVNGSNGNWIWSNNCTQSNATGHSTTGHALFQGSGCQYGNGGSTTYGDLQTPTISVGSYGGKVTFNYFHASECQNPGYTCSYDVLTFQASTNGGSTFSDIYSTDGFPSGMTQTATWTAVSYTLQANTTYVLRWNFNSIDGIGNNYDGIYVDDILVEGFAPCSGTPSANAVVTPTAAVCPNSPVNISLQLPGYSPGTEYQWYASTQSSLGVWTAVPGATNAVYTAPGLTTTTYFIASITCSLSAQSVTATVNYVNVQPITLSTVPYFEGFEGIAGPNKLPNCSWKADNIGSQAYTYLQSNTDGRIPHSGTNFASFYYNPSGTRNFYTNGIWLDAGVTYSASLWYRTDYYGYNNWTELSILAGPNQSSTGQFTIATTGPAISPAHKPLSNTFTVGTSAYYYVNVHAQVSTSSYAYYLSWDDLQIIVPCDLNVPPMTITPNQTVCAGKPISINASGVDTYSWSTGETGNVITDSPYNNSTYTVIGTSTLTGCSLTLVHQVQVFPTPQVGIFADKSKICPGQSAMLTAFGADSYMWSNNTTGIVTSVQPNSTTQYTVYGSNAYGCQGAAVQNIVVNTPVQVGASSSSPLVCIGDPVVLTGSGVASYIWTSPSYYNQSNPATAYPKTTTAYTVTGTDLNGCASTSVVVVSTQDCTGLNEIRTGEGIKVFPNPNTGHFTIVVPAKAKVDITDLTGRRVASVEGNGALDINISELSNGVYYVKVTTESGVNVVRIVKE
jgi:hypothetical protein